VVTITVEATEEGSNHQRTLRPHGTGEKVRSHQQGHVDMDEFSPGHALLTCWGGRQTMALENIAHRLVTDRQAQVGEGADDPVIAPGAILAGQPHYERLELLVNAGTSNRLTWLYVTTLLRGKLAVPGQDGVGLDKRRDLFQSLLAELLARLSEGSTTAIAQLYTTSDLLAEDTILCGYVGITQPKLFVNRRTDRHQPLFPIHACFYLRRDLPY
jgi:hypothetical protein